MPFLGMSMRKLIRWKQVIAIALIALVFAIGACEYWRERGEILGAIEGKLQIHFLDVGQGDATLLILPTGERVMIDVGPKSAGENLLTHFAKWKVDAIDYLILSHSHADHAGALSLLEQEVGIGMVLYAGEAPEICRSPIQELFPGDCFVIGDLQFCVLGPLTTEDNENRSMVLRIDYEDTSFLFTGDAEEAEETLLLNTCPDLLDVDLLKVAHHGSDTSTQMPFIEAVTPEFAVISASADNSFGHPSPNVVNRLRLADCIAISTHRDGTILFLSDGKSLTRFRPNRWL